MCIRDRSSGKPVKFLAAAKSMRRKYVGAVAKAMGAIGVERPQDLAKKCEGLITTDGSNQVTGHGTQFTKEFAKGDLIWIGEGPLAGESAPVLEIVTDSQILTKTALSPTDAPLSFKQSQHIDQSSMFGAVSEELASGGFVGVFPEGGSHDRTSLLPFKAGIAVMALKTLVKHPETPLRIVPVGLNYSNADRFRSTVFVEFGDPIQVPTDILEKYKAGGSSKVEAGNQMLEIIQEAHHDVTIQVEDEETRKLLWGLRRIYASGVSERDKLAMQPASAEEQRRTRFQIMRSLADGYARVQHLPAVQSLVTKVRKYHTLLEAYGVRDHQVAHRLSSRSPVTEILLWRLLIIATASVFCVPGLVLASPCVIVSRIVSTRKAAEALKGSTVKIEGRDVVATWKLMISLVFVPLLHTVYTLLVARFGGEALATVYFFFMPFVSFFSIKMFEDFFALIRSLKPLLMVMLSRDQAERLVDIRSELEKQSVQVIDQVNWLQ
eukprot:TRINITY_DN15169_c0_g2_i5.p1 TRINITY_DN15169_c0_g2~~TRINITY_DN15169_c0_g2_i5.p1  ORF type:complete len:493 (+),score=85.30 TRINITY_DN15169_c0_g2_i5:142-1620(+)